MNLRRILQSLSLGLFLLFLGNNDVQAQAQLAGVSQDGLIQLGANHPFVVDQYVMDLSHLNIQSAAGANTIFRKYLDEGFSITYDLGNDKAYLNLDLNVLSQTTGDQIPVDQMNQKLKDVHRLRR